MQYLLNNLTIYYEFIILSNNYQADWLVDYFMFLYCIFVLWNNKWLKLCAQDKVATFPHQSNLCICGDPNAAIIWKQFTKNTRKNIVAFFQTIMGQNQWGMGCVLFKLGRITQPMIALHLKLADLTITGVRTHVKSMVGIRLQIESSTFELKLDPSLLWLHYYST